MRAWCLIAIVIVGISGIGSSLTGVEHSIHTVSIDEGFSFEWDDFGPDFGYLLEYEPGSATCYFQHRYEGHITDESGVGHYFSILYDGHWFHGSWARWEDSAHVGPVNIAGLTSSVIGLQYTYGMAWDSSNLTEPTSIAVMAFGATYVEPLSVGCDGNDASIRFYLADGMEPIRSTTATGGVGAELSSPFLAPPVALGINVMDDYATQTEGDFVLLHVRDEPHKYLGDEPEVEGNIIIRTPDGEETVPLEYNEHGVVEFMRSWRAGGEYGIELNRIAKNHMPLQGILAGFNLNAELGDEK